MSTANKCGIARIPSYFLLQLFEHYFFFWYAFLSAFHVLHLLRSLLNGEWYFLALVGTIHQIPVCHLIKATWWPFEPGDAGLAA